MTSTPRAKAKRSTAAATATGSTSLATASARGAERRRASIGDARGWTLIELVVVMTIIALLAGMAMATHKNAVVLGREAVLKEDLFRMRDALDQYFADKSQYPATLDALVTDGYLRRLPKDPFTDSESSWQTVQAEPDPANLTTEPGISDIKSGSELQALDGSNYSDW